MKDVKDMNAVEYLHHYCKENNVPVETLDKDMFVKHYLNTCYGVQAGTMQKTIREAIRKAKIMEEN